MTDMKWQKFSLYAKFVGDLLQLPMKESGIRNIKAKRKPYQFAFPRGNYAPWLENETFIKIFNQIQKSTLVDVYRCWELWSLVRETSKVGGDIVEVGVWRGGTGCLLGAATKHFGTEKKVYLCDTFQGVVKTTEKDSHYVGGEHKDTNEEMVIDLAKKLNLEHVHILKGIFPDETSRQIESQSVSLCHIDVDTYLSAKDTFEWVWEKLAVGGVVIFDDYGFPFCDGVRQFVHEIRSRKNLFYLHNLNGHAVIVKMK